MTSCSDILITGKLGPKRSVKGWANSIIPEVLIAAVFDGYVSLPPQRPSPERGGAGGENGRGSCSIGMN
jgi:hypothetical protein